MDIIEKKHILIFLSVSYERLGELKNSLYYYKLLSQYSKSDKQLKAKIKDLESQLMEKSAGLQ